jgi:dTDP-4-amino-4,6-dideoxygalactose transaminase
MSNRPAILGGSPLMDREAGIVRPSIAEYTTPELMNRIESILKSNLVTNGPTVQELEKAMAAYLGVEHVAAVSSCTQGQALGIAAAGLKGKKMIVPSFTIAATANAAYWNQCEIVFADIDLDTFNISLDHLEELMGEDVGAVMPVHVFGNPSPVDEIQAIASRYGATVIYDAAQGFGAEYHEKKLGGNGLFEVFSGSPTKHFTSAEGGFVATNDAEIARLVRLARNYGVLPNYDSVIIGLNARMPEINAAIGLAILPGTNEFITNRNRYARMYREGIGGLPGIKFQEVTAGAYSSYNYLGLMVEASEFGVTNRELSEALKAEHIATKVYYHPPVHQQTAYVEIYGHQTLPNTEFLADRIICLPLYNSMEDSLIESICEAVRRVHEHSGDVKAAIASKMASV